MGKIKAKRFNSIRPIFSIRNFCFSLFRKRNLILNTPIPRPLEGFTLVELIIVTAILGILAGLVLFTLNPFTQLAKARDAQRQNDIKQLQSALDTYYNDNNYYPSTSNPWLTSNDLGPQYIKKIPVDPEGKVYVYLEDPSSRPQWNALFTRLSALPATTISCPLVQLEAEVGDCLPENYESGYNYCVVSGDVKCSDIASLSLPDLGIPTSAPTPPAGATDTPTSAPTAPPGATNTPTPTITPTPTPAGPTNSPTPTPTPVICSNYYAYTTGPNCNDLGPDPGNQCTIHGGSFICYKSRTGSICDTQFPCAQ